MLNNSALSLSQGLGSWQKKSNTSSKKQSGKSSFYDDYLANKKAKKEEINTSFQSEAFTKPVQNLIKNKQTKIPVDIAREDYFSAGLSALGAIPVVGEIADTAKIANKADDIVDATKMLTRSSKGNSLLGKISNSKLTNTVKEIYRPGAKVGDGGLADAIRHELETGTLVGGKSHLTKGRERLKNLERILEKRNFDY